MADEYKHGSWNVLCDRCGFKYKSGQLRKEWTGLMTCTGPNTNKCWEPKHPQLSIRAKIDRQATAWSRPEPSTDRDVSVGSGNEVSASDL